jgi:phosphoribosylformimino-5-aminoimidazole carboxamide ribotide isomerase
MPILPVLDLRNGQIVRGIGGRREEYRPIVSKLVDSAEPLAVATAFCVHFGFTELYLADLDAIQDSTSAIQVYTSLRNAGFRLWIDAGIPTAFDARLSDLLDLGVASIVVGLESVAAPDELQRIVKRAGRERIVFSLDLKKGKSLARCDAWRLAQPWLIAEQAISLGIRRMIVLDLASLVRAFDERLSRPGIDSGWGRPRYRRRELSTGKRRRFCARRFGAS